MSHEPRRPVFGFLWPKRTGPTPVNPQRWERVPARGIVRWLLMLVVTGGLVSVLGTLMLGLLLSRSVGSLMAGVGLLVLLAPAIALVVRGWVMGTYVNEFGVKTSGLLQTVFVPWSDVAAIDVRRSGVALALVGGGEVMTSVRRHSIDVLGRDEAWQIAVDRLALWHRECH